MASYTILILGFNLMVSFFSIISSQHCNKIHCEKEDSIEDIKNCTYWDPAQFNEDSPSILYGEGFGRFGNQLMIFMIFLQLKKQLGIDSYIAYECQNYVKAFFEPNVVTKLLPVLSEVYCNPEDIKSRLIGYNGPFKDLVNDITLHKGKLIEFYPETKDRKGGYGPEEHISDEQDAFNKAYVKILREDMPFRDNLKEKINKRLESVARKYYKDKKIKDVTFVGLHVRRTDHLHYVKEKYNLKPLNADYYNDAMEYFQEEYDNCVFIVASDDMKWTRRNLDKKNNKIYFSDQNPTFHKSTKFQSQVEDDDISKAAFDFVLLTSCNHTIISRGTYSMWIALLTPGEYMTEYGVIIPVN